MLPQLSVELAFGTATPSVMAPDRLAACFESLGDGCEFGLLQRFCGLEALGLFRFASIPFDHLLDLLRQRLAPLMQPDCVSVFVPDGDREWWGRVAAYGINYHAGRWWTGDESDAHGEAAVLAGERKRIPFLARKLLQDLETPHKIFVRRELGRSQEEMRALSQSLRAYGDHALLWIDFARSPDQVGTVERLGDGFARGFVGRFPANAAPSIDGSAVWLRLLQAALVLLRPHLAIELMAGTPPARRIVVPCTVGEPAEAGSTEEVAHPFEGGPVIKCRLTADAVDTPAEILSAPVAGLPPSAFHVVSCYVWLPEPGCGSVLLSVPSEALWTWRTEPGVRNGWQRIATSFHGGNAATTDMRLMATGRQNDTFYAAHWRIEPGAAPADGRPDLKVEPSPA